MIEGIIYAQVNNSPGNNQLIRMHRASTLCTEIKCATGCVRHEAHAETKISGEQGYLQAHHECHQIVNIDKGHALHLQRVDFATLDRKDELEEYEICWEFVKGIVIDNNYPDLRLPSRKERTHSLTDFEAHKELVTRNSKVSVLPNKLDELTSKNLIDGQGYDAKRICHWSRHAMQSMELP